MTLRLWIPEVRTPLHLAVSLGHLESVRVLLRHGAEVTKENAKNWTVLQEAVSTGDPEMVQLVLQRRDYLKASTALGGVPELLSKIREVFSVNNVNVVIRTRTEHLTDEEKARIKSERNILESLLGTVEQHISAQGDLTLEYATATNPTAITPEEYFDPDFDLGDRDIGRPIELSIRTQKFKGTLWMSEEHPLSLVEQVTPIIDLMARTSSHFARLRDFVTLKFPPGFPVKIEIPLFHVLNARITFGNVNKCSTEEEALTTPAATPTSSGEDEEAAALPPFQVCPAVFEVPASYHRRGGSRHTPVSNNDEELLQYAIHQSLLESRRVPGQEGIWDDADGDLTDVLHSSQSDRSIPEGVLVEYGDTTSPASSPSGSSTDTELRLAMELSARAQAEEEKMRRQEEEELERILQLSLTEK
ncbi:Ankyrin repeat domain-containing protein 13A [Nibea albiflora]|uniref:Ankyrin repeat domain-containing protein 13A n=1 Tax=Nibea albiflora TaxID=240163 RepID=A0ACB7FBX9_NIBAL|nr:Ankyrin repeat domain-containing protein 13A [Nibea albiflora]